MQQRQASPHTIASYRETFRQLVRNALWELRKAPAALCIRDLETDFLGAFLTHLETERGDGARSRPSRRGRLPSPSRQLR